MLTFEERVARRIKIGIYGRGTPPLYIPYRAGNSDELSTGGVVAPHHIEFLEEAHAALLEQKQEESLKRLLFSLAGICLSISIIFLMTHFLNGGTFLASLSALLALSPYYAPLAIYLEIILLGASIQYILLQIYSSPLFINWREANVRSKILISAGIGILVLTAIHLLTPKILYVIFGIASLIPCGRAAWTYHRLNQEDPLSSRYKDEGDMIRITTPVGERLVTHGELVQAYGALELPADDRVGWHAVIDDPLNRGNVPAAVRQARQAAPILPGIALPQQAVGNNDLNPVGIVPPVPAHIDIGDDEQDNDLPAAAAAPENPLSVPLLQGSEADPDVLSHGTYQPLPVAPPFRHRFIRGEESGSHHSASSTIPTGESHTP